MVSYKGPYGQVSVGSIGSTTAGNGSGLPPGWQVVSINDKSGLLTLMKNKRNISFYPGNVEEQIASYLEGFNP